MGNVPVASERLLQPTRERGPLRSLPQSPFTSCSLPKQIVFPAGILQPPFFSQDWPGYLSYGSFGQVAAHELTHAFDSAGRLYNPEGKLEEWWTKATSEGFNVRQKCLAKQYSSYYVLDQKGNKVYVNVCALVAFPHEARPLTISLSIG